MKIFRTTILAAALSVVASAGFAASEFAINKFEQAYRACFESYPDLRTATRELRKLKLREVDSGGGAVLMFEKSTKMIAIVREQGGKRGCLIGVNGFRNQEVIDFAVRMMNTYSTTTPKQTEAEQGEQIAWIATVNGLEVVVAVTDNVHLAPYFTGTMLFFGADD